MNINELYKKFSGATQIINTLEKDFDEVQYNLQNPDEIFLANELERTLVNLSRASSLLEYLDRDIVATGYPCKAMNDRYWINDYELSAGCTVEYLKVEDDVCYWKKSQIEYSDDYYIVGEEGVKLNSLKVRIRK